MRCQQLLTFMLIFWFFQEPLGLVLVLDKQKRVIVGDLKSTPSGQPMAAKACGLINIGDIVVCKWFYH